MSYLASNQITIPEMESDRQVSAFPIKDLVIRGVISGVVLAMSASRAAVPISDESIIPILVAMMLMLCLELIMGVYTVMAKRTNITGMFKNLLWVMIGNCFGLALYGFFFAASLMTKLAFAASNISHKTISIDGIQLLAYIVHHGLNYSSNLLQCLLSS